MMDEKVNSSDVDEKVDDKPQLRDSEATVAATAAENAIKSNDPLSGFVEKEQPKPLLPSSMEAPPAVCEEPPTITSMRSLKTTSGQAEPDSEDLCAAILLACLFCHPLDCLVATTRGCGECVCSLCSYWCGCGPAALQPLLDVTYHCDLCGGLGARCFLCDCPFCDICLQATECLDLLMEISQMLYH